MYYLQEICAEDRPCEQIIFFFFFFFKKISGRVVSENHNPLENMWKNMVFSKKVTKPYKRTSLRFIVYHFI